MNKVSFGSEYESDKNASGGFLIPVSPFFNHFWFVNIVRVRRKTRRAAPSDSLQDSSLFRCKQLLTPDTARRCESIVPLPRAERSACAQRATVFLIPYLYKSEKSLAC